MEKELGRALLAAPVPEELEAQRRVWSVVHAAFVERERVPRRRRRLRPLVAFAVLLAVLAAALTPPGQAVGDWVRDRVAGEKDAEPALARLPAPGRLLVVSERGPWVVRADGSKRLLGRYEDASFSPRGLFVVVTRGRRVVAVEPDGDPRWSVTRPQIVAQARWSPSGFRIAYRAGDTLRVVVGNGEGDRLLARSVAPIAPAWKPGQRHVLAYTNARGRIHLVETDTRKELWRTQPGPLPRELVWSPGGRALLVLTRGNLHRIIDARGRSVRTLEQRKGHVALRAAFSPDGRNVAYTDFDAARDRSSVVLSSDNEMRTLFTGAGRLEDVAWSPDGRWLLAGWPDADQWLFLRVPAVARLVAVGGITREFDPGGEEDGRFPRVAGWCCAP